MVLPLLNVTGVLHLGHALTTTVQVIVRDHGILGVHHQQHLAVGGGGETVVKRHDFDRDTSLCRKLGNGK